MQKLQFGTFLEAKMCNLLIDYSDFLVIVFIFSFIINLKLFIPVITDCFRDWNVCFLWFIQGFQHFLLTNVGQTAHIW